MLNFAKIVAQAKLPTGVLTIREEIIVIHVDYIGQNIILPRPIDPNQEPTVGKLMNLACQICPTRKHARRREEYRGVILCNACTDYWKRNNAVRPLIAFAKRPKGDRAREAGMIRQTKKCANCGTGRSSRWMIGPDGEDNCSECGLFWMYHNMRRPLGVGVGIDVIGPKRETRGPKIMESRKRRLGSVNTGSGSDSENEEVEWMRIQRWRM